MKTPFEKPPLARFAAAHCAGVLSDEECFELKASLVTAVGDAYGVTPRLILGTERTTEIVFARQVILFLARAGTRLSLQRIGTLFDLDHATVLHSARKIRDIVSVYPTDREKITALAIQLFGTFKNLGDKEQRTP